MKAEKSAESAWKLRRKDLLGIIVIATGASGAVVAAIALHVFNLGTPPIPHFTIIMSSQGFNGSKTHYPNKWPIMNVAKGQNVTIHLVNQDATDPHAFAITHYFSGGVTLRPGETYDVKFMANQSGSFLVYCFIYCTPHTYMLNGQLNVA